MRPEPPSQLRENLSVPTETAEDVDASVSAICSGGGQVDARGSRGLRVGSHPALVAQQQKSCQGEAAVRSWHGGAFAD